MRDVLNVARALDGGSEPNVADVGKGTTATLLVWRLETWLGTQSSVVDVSYVYASIGGTNIIRTNNSVKEPCVIHGSGLV